MDEYLSRKIRVLSLLAIVFVVYIHAYNFPEHYLFPDTVMSGPPGIPSFIEYFVSNGLGRFAVPLFFAISGYLFFHDFRADPRVFLGKFAKRLRTLAIPYLLWSALWLAAVWKLQQISALHPAVDSYDLFPADVTRSFLLYRLLLAPVPFQLWFIRDLMLYAALSPLIYLVASRLGFTVLIPLGLLWLLNVRFVVMDNEGVLFFVLGAVLALRGIDLRPRAELCWLPLLLLPCWVALLAVKTGAAYVGGPLLFPLHKISTLCGLFGIWFGYDLVGERLNRCALLSWLTPFTFFIFAGHEPLLNWITNFTLTRMGDGGNGLRTLLVVYALAPLATIAVCIVTGALLRQFTPAVFSLLTGGRGGRAISVNSTPTIS
jgi:surface polysaccharide O-acyltransferase-like enzyme